MSLKVEKTDNTNEVKLEFTVEAEKFEKAIKNVYTQNAKYFNIPGFRKGKAPYQMVEKTYGVEVFYEDAFNEVASEVYDAGIKEKELDVVSKPEIDIVQMEKGKELIFTAIVQTKPEVKLGKYKGVEIKKIEYKVTDEDVEKELTSMTEKNARLVPITDEAVIDGDITVIDFEGFVDGEAFDGGKAEGHELTIGSKSFIPGFEDQIIGMKVEEEKDINVKFPDEYFSDDLAGKDALFKVKLHEVKRKEMPEINDELAKDVSEFDTLEELKTSIKEKQEKANESKAKHETENEAINAVCEVTEIDIPSGMIELEIDNMLKDMEGRLRYQGMSMEQYLQMVGKTVEDFRTENKETAEKSVKTRLVIEAVAKDANIEVSEEEISEKIKEMAEMYGKQEDEVKDNPELIKYVTDSLKAEKTVAFIVENVKVK
ncbi:MAG: trigger factor [Oscillospiraceae bacterium]|nr:trigger factor [Oscillospiraceae bacterium]